MRWYEWLHIDCFEMTRPPKMDVGKKLKHKLVAFPFSYPSQNIIFVNLYKQEKETSFYFPFLFAAYFFPQ